MIFRGYVSLPGGKRERKGLEDTGNYGEHMVNKGNHPQMALIQVSEYFNLPIYIYIAMF